MDNKIPFKINLEKNKEYYWCSCGSSKKPESLCDGSHKGTNMSPTKFTVSESKVYFICTCKKSKTKPFCDGSHSR
jgi:CDGSH-type Zn-finger protein